MESLNSIPFQTTVSGNSNNSLEANIDGESLNADTVIASNIAFMGDTTTNISAINNSTNQNIAIKFPAGTPLGTYEFTGGFFADFSASYNPQLGGSTNIYPADSGTLTIKSVSSNSVEGTFNFVATRVDPNDPDVTYTVANGTFSVEIQ